ncbi:hypothetical protein C3492_04495 [Streptomyces sp. Ru62]|nr:hypothetical protein C3492_04495 [Streptomyces sp. Ru62]
MAAARQISGAFTAPVVDADIDGQRPWLHIPCVPGGCPGTHARRHGPLPPAGASPPPASPRPSASTM